MADTPEAERDGQLARQHADDANRDGVGRDVLAALREEVLVLRFAHIDAAAAAADQHAGVGLADLQAGIVPGFTRGNHAKQGRARIPPGIGPGFPRAGPFSARGCASVMVTGGTGAATRQGTSETSNSVMVRVPLTPRLT